MSHFKPTKRSLDLSRKIAEAIGAPFDEQETAKLSQRLHLHYFEQIQRLFPELTEGIEFRSTAVRKIFASISQNHRIDFDEQFDFWLFACAQLNTIAACVSLEGDLYKSLRSLLFRHLDIKTFPLKHEELREELEPFIVNFTDCLELAHPLSRSMIVFIVCHEIAHAKLGHLDEDASPASEFEADKMAALTFSKIIEKGTEAKDIFIHPKMAGAPILSMHYLSLAERLEFALRGNRPSREVHPSPLDRAKALESALSDRLDKDARYVSDNFIKALDDIAEIDELPKLEE